MNLSQHHTPFILSRNPIIFDVEREIHGSTGRFSIVRDGEGSYTGRFYSPSQINVEQIVDAMTPPLPWHNPDGDFIQCLESGNDLSKRSFEISTWSEEKKEKFIYEFYSIPGGVPIRHEQAIPRDTPILARFLNEDGNRFLTVRTAEWLIEIPEEEVYPLYFLSDGEGLLEFSFHCMEDGISESIDTGIYCLDINALRKFVWENYGSIPSVIDVTFGGTPVRIVITKQSPAKNRQKVLFVNSLGAPEIFSFEPVSMVEITGPLQDKSNYQAYSYETSLFESKSQRSTLLKEHDFTIILKSEAEATMFLEMLNSENCWLYDSDKWIKVIPTFDKIEIDNDFKSPQTVSFKVAESQSDTCLLPPIGEAYSTQPKLFSQEFTNEFK